MASSVKEALAAARKATAAEPPDAKKSRVEGKERQTQENSSGSGGSSLQAGVADHLRDYLKTKQHMENMVNAKMFSIILHDEETQSEVKAMADHWHSKWNEHKKICKEAKDKPQPTLPPPIPFKKNFMFGALMETIANYYEKQSEAKMEDKGGPLHLASGAATSLAEMNNELMDLVIGNCSTEYSTPMKNRVWKWDLVLTDMACDRERIMMRTLIGVSEEKGSKKLEVVQRRVHADDKELWNFLKSQPKRKPRK